MLHMPWHPQGGWGSSSSNISACLQFNVWTWLQIKKWLKTASCQFSSGFTFKWILKNLLVFRDDFGIVDKSLWTCNEIKEIELFVLVVGGKSSRVSFFTLVSPWPFRIELEQKSSAAGPGGPLLPQLSVSWERSWALSQTQSSLLVIPPTGGFYNCWIWNQHVSFQIIILGISHSLIHRYLNFVYHLSQQSRIIWW